MLLSSFSKKVRGNYSGNQDTLEHPSGENPEPLPTSRQTQNLNIIYRRFVLLAGSGHPTGVKLACQPSPTQLLFSFRARQGKHPRFSSILVFSYLIGKDLLTHHFL